MSAPIVPLPTAKPNMRMSVEQLSAEAAQERAVRRRRYSAAGRKVLQLGREKLIEIAQGLNEVPTDMPASEDVKDAYEAAFQHMRRQEWPEAREQLLDLGLAAFGWAARIDVAETREELDAGRPAPKPAPKVQPPKGAPRICERCSGEFKLAGPGRPPKFCPECRA